MSKLPYEGLTSRQVSVQRKKFGLNILKAEKPNSSLMILLKVIKEPMILLLLVSGGIYFLIGDRIEAFLLLFMISFVTFITFIQEKKTEGALDALKNLANPRVKTLRNGKEIIVPGYEIVPGDIVKVAEGDRIPADGIILKTPDIFIDEAAITGESLPVNKGKKEIVYSGTLVTAGWAYVKIESIGQHTKIGEIGSSLATIEETPTKIQQETKRLTIIFATTGLTICVAIIIFVGFSTHQWATAVLQGIAIAMSLLPEEFPVVITIFTALGALRIAKKKVLMTNLPTLETLGSATVLCTDKTGTLTQNKMIVGNLITKTGQFFAPTQQKLSAQAKQLLLHARLGCHGSLTDSMEKAINEAWEINNAGEKLPTIQEFSSLKQNRLFMVNKITITKNNCYYVAKGAPEAILQLCSNLSPSTKKQAQSLVKQCAATGARILAVAKSSPYESHQNFDVSDLNFEYAGLICLSDPVRSEAKAAINACHQAGIRVIMITGDFPETAKSIGQSIGLTGLGNVLTGEELKQLSAKDLQKRIKATNICARIMPSQKLQLVNALKKNHEIVAMTGDGVNDAPALKAANMGIAMGQKGTDVAREAADMVLTDDNFTSIVKAIEEGRRIFTNIRKAVGFIIAVHIPIALTAVFPTLLGWPFILTPVHIVILELIIDPTCTLVFEQEPEEPNTMNEPPRKPSEKLFNRQIIIRAITAGLAVFIAIMLSYLMAQYFNLNDAQTRLVAFLTLVYGDLGLILSFRSTKGSFIQALKTPNKAFWIVATSITAFMTIVVSVPSLQQLFDFAPITFTQVGIIAGLTVLTVVLEIVFSKITAKIRS